MTEPTPPTMTNARHRAKMAKKKAARDRMMETKTGEKGLIIVHTGPGKGKSSSGFGMILRCVGAWDALRGGAVHQGRLGHGRAALLETRFRDDCASSSWRARASPGKRRTSRATCAAAADGWEKAKGLIRDPAIRFVLLDEINIALRYDYLDIAEVVAFLRDEKPPMTHVCLTGRNAKPELIEIADLVTEMTLVKHPFRSGIKAQAGVEF